MSLETGSPDMEANILGLHQIWQLDYRMSSLLFIKYTH